MLMGFGGLGIILDFFYVSVRQKVCQKKGKSFRLETFSRRPEFIKSQIET